MSSKRGPIYSDKPFEMGLQPSGPTPTTRNSLAEKGLLKKPEAPKGRARGGSTRAARKETVASPGDGLPARSRSKRQTKGRHFRLPVEIDAELQELTRHHDATMVWVVSKLIRDEWIRVRRLAQRSARADDDGDAGGDAGGAEDPS